MSRGKSFADRLTHLMDVRHITTIELQRELGGVVTERTIRRWRSGAAAPGIEVLPFLARALHTMPNTLVGWMEEE